MHLPNLQKCHRRFFITEELIFVERYIWQAGFWSPVSSQEQLHQMESPVQPNLRTRAPSHPSPGHSGEIDNSKFWSKMTTDNPQETTDTKGHLGSFIKSGGCYMEGMDILWISLHHALTTHGSHSSHGMTRNPSLVGLELERPEIAIFGVKRLGSNLQGWVCLFMPKSQRAPKS